MWTTVTEAWSHPQPRAAMLVGASILAAILMHLVAAPVLRALVRRTTNVVDDAVAAALPAPIAWTALLAGIWFATEPLGWPPPGRQVLAGLLLTTGILLWGWAVNRVSLAFLHHLEAHQDDYRLVDSRTLPLFDIGVRTLVFGGATYFLMLAWRVDVTGWLASAGVLGVAVGFAAKDSLSNLFAGLFIIADAPYKLGDYLIIDAATRGRVTRIGLRSTRLLTRDEVEIIVPNSVMASARITNESGGPMELERIRCSVQVAYGSDLDQVRAVLMEVSTRVPQLVHGDPERAPRVRFRAFEDSGIKVDLMAWIPLPELRGAALDRMVYEIWQAFSAAGIEIPFPQRELRLRQP